MLNNWKEWTKMPNNNFKEVKMNSMTGWDKRIKESVI